MRFETELGTVGISNEAIAAVAGHAAQNCFGVKAMGGKAPAVGLAQLLRREAQPGVTVHALEDGRMEVELHVAVNYGVNIPAICRSIISQVCYDVEKMTGAAIAGVQLFVDALRP